MPKLTSQTAREPSTPTQNDQILQDLRAQYEQTLLKHNEAKAHLARLRVKEASQAETNGTIVNGPGIATLRQRHLEAHLENLRLQKRHKDLRILSQYAEQADSIATDEGIFDVQEAGALPVSDEGNTDQQAALATTQQHLEDVRKDVKSRTNELEIALVKARQQLKLETNLLEKARSRSRVSQNGTNANNSALAKQRTLEVTRDELQQWIADSLARCEKETRSPAAENASILEDHMGDSTEDVDIAIETEYEQYLETRTRLVQMARALRRPLLDPGNETGPAATSNPPPVARSTSEDQKQRLPMQRAPHLRHKSRISVHKLAEQTVGPSLSKIESSLLPSYHHDRLLNAHLAHLEGQTSAQDARLLQGLGLLSHESHLLPSYPSNPADVSAKRGKMKDASQQQLDIEHLLSAWGFASNSAEAVLQEGVLGNIEETKDALDGAKEHLREIQVLEDMKKRVTMG